MFIEMMTGNFGIVRDVFIIFGLFLVHTTHRYKMGYM